MYGLDLCLEPPLVAIPFTRIPLSQGSPFTRICERPFLKDFWIWRQVLACLEMKWLQWLIPFDPWSGS